MKKLILSQDDAISSRITFIPRFLLAITAGFFICIGGESEHIMELARLPSFYTALFSSVLIAFIAVEQVNYSVLRLRRRFPNEILSNSRSYRQIFACFIMPFVLIFCLASIYYGFHGLLILDTMWIADHAAHILLMLLALNMVFVIMEFIAKKPLEEKAIEPSTDMNPISNNRLVLDASNSEDVIAFVVHEKGYNWITYPNGKKSLANRSLSEIYASLDANLYYLNNMHSIIRKESILNSYRTGGSKWRVEIKFPIGTFVDVSGRQALKYKPYAKKNH